MKDNTVSITIVYCIYEVRDAEGVLRCMFKRGDESSKIEASVYLLDHPADGRRSHSPAIYGFAEVLPTLYVKFVNGDNVMMEDVLVEFMENVSTIKNYLDSHDDDIEGNDLRRMSLLDVCVSNMDRGDNNILIEVEGNIHRCVPIDHETCFGVDRLETTCANLSGYIVMVWNEVLAQDCIQYVAKLDTEEDLAFLGDCEWEILLEFFDRFRILTNLLKKSVVTGFTPFHIGLMASFKCDNMDFNLQSMVSVQDEPGACEENFVNRVGNRMDAILQGIP